MIPLLKTILRDPLGHFAIIGAVLFIVEAKFSSSSDSNSHIIRYNDESRALVESQFRQQYQRQPDSTEKNKLYQRWLESELLYRYGKGLGLDQDDMEIRQIIAAKARGLISNSILPNELELENLKEFYKKNKQMYQGADLFSFQILEESFATLFEAQKKAHDLNQRKSDMPFQNFQNRNSKDVENIFGFQFKNEIPLKPINIWYATQTKIGIRIAKVLNVIPGKQQTFTEMKSKIEKDYRAIESDKYFREALARIKQSYQINTPELM